MNSLDAKETAQVKATLENGVLVQNPLSLYPFNFFITLCPFTPLPLHNFWKHKMKYIKIAERLKPYSHVPGTLCILVGSSYQIQVFPTRLRIFDLAHSEPKFLTELIFELHGPVEDFTIQNDLEKGELRVWGKTPMGFIRYSLKAHLNGPGLNLAFEKIPSIEINVFHDGVLKTVQAKESFSLFNLPSNMPIEFFQPVSIERLSLGNHKAQDWELVHRRLDLTEILPVWHRLGQLTPQPIYNNEIEGTFELLKECRDGLALNQPEKLVQSWTNLYRAGMQGILVPRLLDEQFQGLIHSQTKAAVSPLGLLTESAKLIRKFFIQVRESGIEILPALPPEFHCGRLIDIPFEEGNMSFEWSKKVIRRLEVCMNQDSEITFHFKHVKHYRVRKNMNEKGLRVFSGSSIHLEKNTLYFFDNFQ